MDFATAAGQRAAAEGDHQGIQWGAAREQLEPDGSSSLAGVQVQAVLDEVSPLVRGDAAGE